MTVSLCPLCQSPLGLFSRREVECHGWNCQFSIPLDDETIIAAALAHHMRPLAEPHAYRENPDYPGQCDEAVGDPVQPCNRPKECHQ